MLHNAIKYAILFADSLPEKEFLTNLKKYFNEHADKVNAIKKVNTINNDIKNAIENLNVTWKKEEKDLWIEVLSGFGSKPFMRRDIEDLFSFQKRAANDRIKVLIEANILDYNQNRKDRFIIVNPQSNTEKQISKKDILSISLFTLPELNVPLVERKEEVKDILNILEKTEHVFLSGESRSGKTTLALLCGKYLQKEKGCLLL